MGIEKVFGVKKQPAVKSAAAIQAEADAAAAKERARLQAEQAAKDAASKDKALADLKDQEAKRAAFAGVLATAEGEDAGRKKFLKGA